jgi:hypothetical protein
MYKQYIIDKFLAGGASGIQSELVGSISQISTKQIKAPINAFSLDEKNYHSPNPSIAREEKNQITVETILTSKCKLILNSEERDILIDSINTSIGTLKTELQNRTEKLKAQYQNNLLAYLEELKQVTPTDIAGAHEYVRNIQERLSVVKNKFNMADKDFARKLEALVGEYNKKKGGRHPYIHDANSAFASSSKTKKPESFVGITCTYLIGGKEEKCYITSVDIGGGYVYFTYGVRPATQLVTQSKARTGYVKFNELCFVDKKIKQKTEPIGEVVTPEQATTQEQETEQETTKSGGGKSERSFYSVTSDM